MTYFYVLILNLNLKCMHNKPFESDIDIKRIFYLTSPGKSASKHHEYAGYEFESHSRFFFLQIFSHSFHDFLGWC